MPAAHSPVDYEVLTHMFTPGFTHCRGNPAMCTVWALSVISDVFLDSKQTRYVFCSYPQWRRQNTVYHTNVTSNQQRNDHQTMKIIWIHRNYHELRNECMVFSHWPHYCISLIVHVVLIKIMCGVCKKFYVINMMNIE